MSEIGCKHGHISDSCTACYEADRLRNLREALSAERAAHEQTKATDARYAGELLDEIRLKTERIAALESELARAKPLLYAAARYAQPKGQLAGSDVRRLHDEALAYARAHLKETP